MRFQTFIFCRNLASNHKYSFIRILIIFSNIVAVTKVIFLFREEYIEFDLAKKSSLTDEPYSVPNEHKKDTIESKHNKNFGPKNTYNINMFVVENIEKYPIKFKKITEEAGKTKSDVVIAFKNSKISEFKMFDKFLKTYYFPQEIFSINDFRLILYFLDYLKVYFDVNFMKIINCLFYNLKILFDKEKNILSSFIVDSLISNEISVSFFKKIFEEYQYSFIINEAYIGHHVDNPEVYFLLEASELHFINEKHRILKINNIFLDSLLNNNTNDFFIKVLLALLNVEVLFIQNLDLRDTDLLSKFLLMITYRVNTIVFDYIIIDDIILSFITNNQIFSNINNLYFYNYHFIEVSTKLHNLLDIKQIVLIDSIKDLYFFWHFSHLSESLDQLKLLVNEKSLNIGNIKNDFLEKPELKKPEYYLFENFDPEKHIFLEKDSMSKIIVLKAFNYKCSYCKCFGYMTEKNALKNLSIEISNAKIENFYTLKHYINMNIRTLKIFQCTMTFEALINILNFPCIKELELINVEIIQITEKIKINRHNKSLLTLKIIEPKIFMKNKIYDFIHLFDKLECLDLKLNGDLIGEEKCIIYSRRRNVKNLCVFTFVNNKVSFYDIHELSYFNNTKKIEFREIKHVGFFSDLFYNQKLLRIETLILKECDFYEADIFSLNLKNLENLKFEMCIFNKIEFYQLFQNTKENNINQISLIECRITESDIFFLSKLKCLTYLNLIGCYAANSTVLKIKKNNFLTLKSFYIYLICDEKLNLDPYILFAEFGLIFQNEY